MKFERFFNSKFFKIMELLYRLLLTNLVGLLGIIIGLGLFSLMSSIVSMIIIVKSINSNTDFSIMKVFFKSFKENYKRIIVLSLFYYLFIAIAVFNAFYFYSAFIEFGGLFFEVGFNISLVVVLLVLAAFINAAFIYVYFPNLSNLKIVKYSFTLIRIIIRQFFLIVIYLIGIVLLVYTIPLLIVFIYISLGLFFINMTLRKTYIILVPDGVNSLDAFMYN